MTEASFLVLVTGHAAAGKTTLAPRLAEEFDALWISRDAIHEMVYAGWDPRHPSLSSSQYDPQVGESTFREGVVVWRIFLWMLARVAARVPVVADTPFNHEWNRVMLREAAPDIPVPMIEVALHGDPDVVLSRARARAKAPGAHELKRFAANSRRHHNGDYQPVLESSRVIHVDTTDLAAVDVAAIARQIRTKLAR